MKSSFLCLALSFLTVFASCSDPVAPKQVVINPNPKVGNFNFANLRCGLIPKDPNQIPIDIYPWGYDELPERTDINIDEYKALQPWLHAATLSPDYQADSSGLVEIKYFALISRDKTDPSGTSDKLVAVLDYGLTESGTLNMNQGGLFGRWYDNTPVLPMSNAKISNSTLKVHPSLHPKRISHWWLNDSGKYPRDPSKNYYVTCELKVTGPVAVQIAADLYKDLGAKAPEGNTEMFHSAWQGDTGGKFITICYPQLR